MKATSYCQKCGAKVYVHKKDPFMAKMLQDSEYAICKSCDKASGWRKEK